MPGSKETPRTTSSVLKTTTWGALIALSGAIFAAGVLGYNPWTHYSRSWSPLRSSSGAGPAVGRASSDAESRWLV